MQAGNVVGGSKITGVSGAESLIVAVEVCDQSGTDSRKKNTAIRAENGFALGQATYTRLSTASSGWSIRILFP